VQNLPRKSIAVVLGLVVLLPTGLLLSGCQKDETPPSKDYYTGELKPKTTKGAPGGKGMPAKAAGGPGSDL